MSRERTVLHHSDEFEVVSIEWNGVDDSVMHDHAYSRCAVQIVEGLFENTLELGFKTEVRVLEAGQSFNTPIGAQHRMKCLSARGKTLHVYTPKIREESAGLVFKNRTLPALKEKLELTDPTRIEELKRLLDFIREQSISTRSPYFMNQLFSGVAPQMLLAEELVAQTKTTLATQEASPVFSAIESMVIDALGGLIGWAPSLRDGVSVPGGSAANFMALHCARQKHDPKIKLEGMSGQKFKIFVSEAAHYSFMKAAVAMGFGTQSVVTVAVDENGKMKPSSLEALILESLKNGETPLLICATAGTTVYGAFDPIHELSKVSEKYKLWLHVMVHGAVPLFFLSRCGKK
jgi:quercetin dioxygenase-like cupin family protein